MFKSCLLLIFVLALPAYCDIFDADNGNLVNDNSALSSELQTSEANCKSGDNIVVIVDSIEKLWLQIGKLRLSVRKQNVTSVKEILNEIQMYLNESYVPQVNKLVKNVTGDVALIESDKSKEIFDSIPALLRYRRELHNSIREISNHRKLIQREIQIGRQLNSTDKLSDDMIQELLNLNANLKQLTSTCIEHFQMVQQIIKFQNCLDREIKRIVNFLNSNEEMVNENNEPSKFESFWSSVSMALIKLSVDFSEGWQRFTSYISSNPFCFIVLPFVAIMFIFLIIVDVAGRLKE